MRRDSAWTPRASGTSYGFASAWLVRTVRGEGCIWGRLNLFPQFVIPFTFIFHTDVHFVSTKRFCAFPFQEAGQPVALERMVRGRTSMYAMGRLPGMIHLIFIPPLLGSVSISLSTHVPPCPCTLAHIDIVCPNALVLACAWQWIPCMVDNTRMLVLTGLYYRIYRCLCCCLLPFCLVVVVAPSMPPSLPPSESLAPHSRCSSHPYVLHSIQPSISRTVSVSCCFQVY